MTKKHHSSANLRPLYSGDTWVLDSGVGLGKYAYFRSDH